MHAHAQLLRHKLDKKSGEYKLRETERAIAALEETVGRCIYKLLR